MEKIIFIVFATLIAVGCGLAYGNSTHGLKRPIKYALVVGAFIGVVGGAVCLVLPGVGVISACGWQAVKEFSVCIVGPSVGFTAACLVLVGSIMGSLVGCLSSKGRRLL